MSRMRSLSMTPTLAPSEGLRVSVSAPLAAGLAAVLSVLGLGTVWTSVVMLWALWTTDALKSVGMVVPVVSFLLVLRVWRSLNWEVEGSWWGFALLVVTALLVRLRDQAVMVLTLSREWHLYFPPHALVMCAYGLGTVLLFGGWRLARASLFPLLLLLLVDPIPHFFNLYVDLPLQRASAHVARGFAHALGQTLSPDKLRLMFTPEFGMFIAPGCNGIRGAVTMGMIALVAGYLYRVGWRLHVLLVLGAMLLGYLLNFLRLCVLVLFYVSALHIAWLQDRAEGADYLIGAALFFVAVYLLYQVVEGYGESRKTARQRVWKLPPVHAVTGGVPLVDRSFYARALAMTLLVVVGVLRVASGWASSGSSLGLNEAELGQFPRAVGGYTLVRRWNESLFTGGLLFYWAEYSPPGAGATHIAVGISPVLGSHDTLVCHTARGEDPIWHGQQTIQTAEAEPINFSTAFYNDGATQYLEATTLCNGASCGEYVSPQTHFGFTYSRVDPEKLLSQRTERPIPILLRAETVNTTLPVDVAREQLSKDVSSFLRGASLDALTRPYRGH